MSRSTADPIENIAQEPAYPGRLPTFRRYITVVFDRCFIATPARNRACRVVMKSNDCQCRLVFGDISGAQSNFAVEPNDKIESWPRFASLTTSEPMLYLEKPPHPVLHAFVRTLWYCRAPQLPRHRQRVFPDGSMQIILNLSRSYLTDCGTDGTANTRLSRAIVVGARTRYQVVDTLDMEDLAGILFQPGGFSVLFRERANLFSHRFVALDDVWPDMSLADRLAEVQTPDEKLSILEMLLTQLLRERTRRTTLVEHAIHLFRRGPISVGQCARSVGVSDRRLSQVFREEVGMSPKMWCRIHRFQTAMRALHKGADVRWAELAVDCGYCDQAHFANDFRAFSGVDPTTYSRYRGTWQNHLLVP